MKKIITVVMAAMLVVIPMSSASAQISKETVQEKAQKLAAKIVSDYGVNLACSTPLWIRDRLYYRTARVSRIKPPTLQLRRTRCLVSAPSAKCM